MLFNLALLAPVADIEEKFPGELREVVIAALLESKSNAEQSGRERRAVLLSRQFQGTDPAQAIKNHRIFVNIISYLVSSEK